MADDPTLQGCCRKDLQQQARAAQIKSSLLAVDPSQIKQKLQQQVINTQPHKEDSDSNSDAGSLHVAKLQTSSVTDLRAEGTAGAYIAGHLQIWRHTCRFGGIAAPEAPAAAGRGSTSKRPAGCWPRESHLCGR